MSYFLALVIDGALAGAIYALIALAFVLVYRASAMMNFALGEWVVFGAMLAGTGLHFLHLGTLLSGCRLIAADVNGINGVDTVDVIAIQRFFLVLSTGIANAGKYQFAPVNRSYPGLVSNQINQNYDTLVFGDVATPFVH